MTAHKHPVAPVPAAGRPLTAVGTNPIGAVAMPTLHGSTGEATAPNLSTPSMPCRECDGKGEAEYMGLCDRYYRWADCHKCFGAGREAPYCETCQGKLTVDGFCYACDDYALVFVERIAPGRIAL